ncbi:hypothetical protein LIER_30015 [Lithospermum erythrorhizon]|uniref:ATP-dependent DNA helicase n=1 Tax=Lithospermum erythrorhizon TaxID=34254 RepID=A0AAV3RQ51_LITER
MSFQSSEAELIRTSRIIIWDEAPMAEKLVIHALNHLLQELCENKSLFGGKLVVFDGDFRQVLLVVPRGSRKEQVDASIVSSSLWEDITKLKLTSNMRAKDDQAFIEFLMRVGDGREPTNDRGEIKIPRPMIIPYSSIDESLETLIHNVYPDMSLFETAPFEMMKRSILCPKNEFVNDINFKLIERFPGHEVIYTSYDRAKSAKDQGDYVDYLNSLEPKGLPCHRLILKELNIQLTNVVYNEVLVKSSIT